MSPTPNYALVHDLPMPISGKLHEYLSEDDPKMSLYLAKEFLEVILKFFTAIGLSEFDELDADFQLALRERQLHRPTFGNWINLLRFVVENQSSDFCFKKLSASYESLNTFLGEKHDSIDHGFLALRNMRLARGGNFPRAEASRLYSIWHPKILELVNDTLAWTKDIKVVGFDSTQNCFLLRGLKPKVTSLEIPSLSNQEVDQIAVVTGTNCFSLSPLAIFNRDNQIPMLYVRKDANLVQYVKFSMEGGLHKSNARERNLFISRFESRLDQNRSSDFVVKSFDHWIEKESERRVGREKLLDDLLFKLSSEKMGNFYLVSGPAGVGKSNLVCSVMKSLTSEPTKNSLILPYIFKQGDQRCSRQKFLRFFEERLVRSDFYENRKEIYRSLPSAGLVLKSEDDHQGKISLIAEMLNAVPDSSRILVLIDGLDEVVQNDEKFIDEILSKLISERVVILVSTRDVHGIKTKLNQMGATDVFPDGFPQMNKHDVSEFLMERAEGFQKKFIACESEKNGVVRNAFFEEVAERSAGLPIYLNCLLSDLHEGLINPENRGALPKGIKQYHQKLLSGHAISDLHALMTPAIVLLALAHEPLTITEITTFLHRSRKLNSHNLELVNRLVAVISPMLREALDPGGELGFTIYHHSLRQHVFEDPNLNETVLNVRRFLAEFSSDLQEDKLEEYFYRCGIRHLLEIYDFEKASEMMTNFGYTLQRFRCLSQPMQASDNWYADWDRIRRAKTLLGEDQKNQVLYDRKNTNVPFKKVEFEEKSELYNWWKFAQSIKPDFEDDKRGTAEIFLEKALQHEEHEPIMLAAQASQVIE